MWRQGEAKECCSASLSGPGTLCGVPALTGLPACYMVQVKSSSWPGTPRTSEDCGILGCQHDDTCQATALFCVGHAATVALVKVPAFSAVRTLLMCVAKAPEH